MQAMERCNLKTENKYNACSHICIKKVEFPAKHFQRENAGPTRLHRRVLESIQGTRNSNFIQKSQSRQRTVNKSFCDAHIIFIPIPDRAARERILNGPICTSRCKEKEKKLQKILANTSSSV